MVSCLFWNAQVNITPFHTCDQAITIKANFAASDLSCLCSVVYAKCCQIDRRSLWDNLLQISAVNSMPWILGGDFNIVSQLCERAGGGSVDLHAMGEFHSFMQQAGLCDPGFSGNIFTWCNNQQGTARIWCRLDRFLINSAFISQFPPIQVSHLARNYSDHTPLILSVQDAAPSPKPFKFMKMWVDHQDFILLLITGIIKDLLQLLLLSFNFKAN
jgi:hypothetical protein